MHTLEVTESRDAEVDLTDVQATALRAAGRALASRARWWGEDESPEDRTVIRCRRDGDRYIVRVIDAIGLILQRDIDLRLKSHGKQRRLKSHRAPHPETRQCPWYAMRFQSQADLTLSY